jgi:dTDP-4-amino-4,6-dideoxygalactose transaminase
VVLGLTARLDTLQAAILLCKLSVFGQELERRRAIAEQYSSIFSGKLTIPVVPDGYRSAWALYTIRVQNRDEVRTRLDSKGIGTGLFYRLALHQHPAFREFVGRALPNSERLANEVVSLPIHPDLTDAEVARVIAAVLESVG